MNFEDELSQQIHNLLNKSKFENNLEENSFNTQNNFICKNEIKTESLKLVKKEESDNKVRDVQETKLGLKTVIVMGGYRYKLHLKQKDKIIYRCEDYKKLKWNGEWIVTTNNTKHTEYLSKDHTVPLNKHTFFNENVEVDESGDEKENRKLKRQKLEEREKRNYEKKCHEHLMLANTLNQMRREGETIDGDKMNLFGKSKKSGIIAEIAAQKQTKEDLEEGTWLMEIKAIIEESYREDPQAKREHILANIAEIPKMVSILNSKMVMISRIFDDIEKKVERRNKINANKPFGPQRGFYQFTKREKIEENEMAPSLRPKPSSSFMIPILPNPVRQVINPQMNFTNIKTFRGTVFGRAFHEIMIKGEIRQFLFLVSDFEINIVKTNINNLDQKIIIDTTWKLDSNLCEWSMIVSILMYDSTSDYFMPIGHVLIQKPDFESFIVWFEWFKREFEAFKPKLIGLSCLAEVNYASQTVFPEAAKFILFLDYSWQIWKMIFDSDLVLNYDISKEGINIKNKI